MVAPTTRRPRARRIHRTLQAEALQGRRFGTLVTCQEALDRWRDVYNIERPHQALQPSRRSFPEELTPITYGDGDETRKVMAEGWVNLVPRRSFQGCHIGLRPTTIDVWSVWFMTHRIAEVKEWKNQNMCKVCPRTPAKFVSGLYTLSPGRGSNSCASGRSYARVSSMEGE